jgi:hypothetical protein
VPEFFPFLFATFGTVMHESTSTQGLLYFE